MLGVTNYGAFVATILAFLFLPGPGNLALVLSAGKGGLLAGLAATVGIVVGDQLLLWSAVAGLKTLIDAHALQVVYWIGSAYLSYLGLRMLLLTGFKPAIDIRAHHYGQQAFMITVLNPKAILFYLAVFPLFVVPGSNTVQTCGVMAITIAGLTFLYGLGATLLTIYIAPRARANGRMMGVFEKFVGLLLLGFGVKLAMMR